MATIFWPSYMWPVNSTFYPYVAICMHVRTHARPRTHNLPRFDPRLALVVCTGTATGPMYNLSRPEYRSSKCVATFRSGPDLSASRPDRGVDPHSLTESAPLTHTHKHQNLNVPSEILVVQAILNWLEAQLVSTPAASACPEIGDRAHQLFAHVRFQYLTSQHLATVRSGRLSVMKQPRLLTLRCGMAGCPPPSLTEVTAGHDHASWDVPMKVARARFGCAVVRQLLYVVGGTNRSEMPETSMEVLNTKASKARRVWEPRSPLPAPRSDHSVVELRGRLYVIGGYGGLDTEVVSFDAFYADVWTERAPLRLARAMAACVAHDDQIYVVGGQGPDPSVSLTRRRARISCRLDQREDGPVLRYSGGVTLRDYPDPVLSRFCHFNASHVTPAPQAPREVAWLHVPKCVNRWFALQYAMGANPTIRGGNSGVDQA
ncbi:uncharacterized protein MONBRDRAFT_9220 [Monosiga brevicollis MX1]|uniref:BACK domain-containing protein n=1 Tax=Monosiga brevicollis TaxID=81824 RepID=A9V2G3_MONBE|nr:uncharacterized protein MONBRDRAFT_9220 [Monosiga brevicollis MX1]EDQ88253.1 predicted protein [Monosiga brevicollis MX1]|eukprot:XP_001746846.1 hypothetical protein [Monosiga brevicollis MX1]